MSSEPFLRGYLPRSSIDLRVKVGCAVLSYVNPGTHIPHCKPGVWPDAIASSRFAAHILQSTAATARVALLGLPDDLGVKLNNGRVGAAQGPTAFRAALAKYGVADPADVALPRVFDAGDVMPAHGHDENALHETHNRVSEAAAAIVKLGLFPIAIGGGHDLTYAFVRGVWRGLNELGAIPTKPWTGFYFDAHLDVRDTVGSGMTFRKLISERIADRLVIVGHDPHANSKSHAEWFESNGGTIVWETPAHWFPSPCPEILGSADNLFVSFDIDVLDQSVAPGVSAMNPSGMRTSEAGTLLALLTASPVLRCLDFMELSPPHDEGGRTARVAAHLFLVALTGLMQGTLCHDNP